MLFKGKTKNKQRYYTLIIQQLSPTTAVICSNQYQESFEILSVEVHLNKNKTECHKTVTVWEITFFFTLQGLEVKAQSVLPRTALSRCILFVIKGSGHLNMDSPKKQKPTSQQYGTQYDDNNPPHNRFVT